MKKITALGLLLFLTACQSGTVTLRNLDKHIDDENYLFIDIRDLEEKYSDGYIEGFTFLPLNSYLFAENILRPPMFGRFRDSDVLDQERLESYLDRSKTIVIICRSGNRSAYFRTVLESLDYDVIDLGGIIHYQGDLLRFPDNES